MKRTMLWMLLLILTLVPAARAAQIPYLSEYDSMFSGIKEELEACAVDLHQTASFDGASITVDQICLSEDYILVFYTARSDKALSLNGDAGDPERWRILWTTPSFRATAPGERPDLGSPYVEDAFMPDECTIRGCVLVELTKPLSSFDQITLTAGGFPSVRRDAEPFPFQWKLTVDPALLAGTRYETNASGEIHTPTGGEWKVEVQSVSFSPMGNRINLKTASSNGASVELAVLDDQGNYLTVLGRSGILSMDATPENPFVDEYPIPFLGGEGSKKLTLIPYDYVELDMADYDPDKPAALLPLDAALPAHAEFPDGTAIFIDQVHVDATGGSVTWRPGTYGQFDFRLCDASGRRLNLGRYVDSHYDYATGATVESWEWKSGFKDGAVQAADEATIARGTHLGISMGRHRLVSLPDQAIEIDLG
jgi:hypothetical protein